MQIQRQLAVVYSVEEALQKVNHMRELGFLEREICIFARNIQELQSLKMYTEINVHQSGNLLDMMKSVVSGRKLHEACLQRFEFSREELEHYGEIIRKGAILIIAQHDFPVEKQLTKSKVKVLQKKLPSQIANPLNVSNKQNSRAK